ncbi:type VI secretion system-associated protein TagF [Bosea sp. 685]|uniref:type VI secretion system-associated protein TagF n=1 Tax=Bosea sp. 685 TaxID=3080057 RepID=UPI0028936051|nr:type VI secretion system-associated protein TagF [Bosea sp. 685]WNJ88315.1 type VI secretion system-associated protein TagF [Bosea sp. 685]
MHCALFGKLPAKRDFIAVNMPRELLRFWEIWLQGGMAASIQALGPGWKEVYLSAPIWRFWLGSSHLGCEVLGAFMPSLDGVGRYFPLAVLAMAPEGQAFAAPTENAQASWFESAEAFLLDTLEPDAVYEATLAALESLPLPESVARDTQPAVVASNRGLLGVSDDATTEIPALLARLERSDKAARQAAGSWWWSIGGDSFPALALRAERLPEAQHFTLLLTGPTAGPESGGADKSGESAQPARIGVEP